MMLLTKQYDWDKLRFTLRMEDAQPREEIVGEMLADIRRGSPWAKVEPGPAPGGCEVLTLWDDFGHHYIYKIVGWDVERDVYQLEWPD